MSRYGANDTWPTHQRKDAQSGLLLAKEAGWVLDYPQGHWGRLSCTVHDPPHQVVIFSTGKGDASGATAKKVILRGLRRCEDSLGSTRAGISVPRSQVVEKAEALVSAVVRLRQRDRLRARSASRIEEASALNAGDDEDILVQQAIDDDVEASAIERAAWVEAQRFGLDDPWPPGEGAAALESEAREALQRAMQCESLSDDEAGRCERIRRQLDELEE